jgi:hypothetical protein
MQSIKCPNCGANNPTNFQNCEFCNSFLVISSEVGFAVSKFKESFYFETIAKALQENINYQQYTEKIDNDDYFATDIYLNKSYFLLESGNCENLLFQCTDSLSMADCLNEMPVRPSITVCFYPENYTDSEYQKLLEFEELKFFSSFIGVDKKLGYVMNFGNDYIGAAKIISKMLFKVKNIGMGTPLFAFTRPGYTDDFYFEWINKIEDNEIKQLLLNRFEQYKSENEEYKSENEESESENEKDLENLLWIPPSILGIVSYFSIKLPSYAWILIFGSMIFIPFYFLFLDANSSKYKLPFKVSCYSSIVIGAFLIFLKFS